MQHHDPYMHHDAMPSPVAASHAAHDKHAGHSVAMFRGKFWLSLSLTIPTLVWGHMLPSALHYSAPALPGSRWIPAVFGIAVFFYGGRVFMQGAIRELRDRLPGMMTLISLAISIAFLFSLAVTFGYPGLPLWEELATLVTIMLLGHWLEMRSVAQAQGAIGALARLLPNTATRLRGEVAEEVPLSDLREGDLVLVRPGQSVAADGIVQQGASSVNESMITGESRRVEKRENDRVVAGTLNGTGSLRVTVTHTGDRTALAGIMRLVEAAQSSRSRAQDLADRAAFWLTVIAVGAGAVTLAGWIIAGQTLTYAIARLVTVLVIACPHALGLAIPLVIAISTTLAARSGLLVRNRRGLEEARRLDTVVFDKTGTLTRGEFGVVDIATANGMTANDALRLAAAVEHDSEHSVARGIVRSAAERKLVVPPATQFAAIPGHGVSARVNGRELAVGGPALIASRPVTVPAALRAAAERVASRGQSALYLLDGDSVVAILAMADVVRAESKPAIAALHHAGLRVVMMTGDAEAVANAVAAELGIDTVFAGVLPGDKAGRIQALRDAGHRVAMVGDGVNDAPALATATVGIAIGAGTEVAVEAGDVVLVRSDPRDVAKLIALSRASWRKMIQNLWWAVGYNVVAIPLAAGVLAPVGIVLTPAVGAILMSLSTVIVALNAQLLRRVTL